MTDEEIKISVSTKSIQYGVPNAHALLFDVLTNEFKDEIYKETSNRQFGLPIIRFSHPNGFWVLLGTKELAWNDGNETQFVELSEIDQIQSLDYEEAKSKEVDPMLVKFQLEQLALITKGHQTIKLYIEKKEAYFAIQHLMIRILKLIA